MDYSEDENLLKKSQKDYESEIVSSIIETQNKLIIANKNYEYAEDELIDYYLYNIKAEKAKFNYLLRKAKKNGIILDFVNDVRFKDIKVV